MSIRPALVALSCLVPALAPAQDDVALRHARKLLQESVLVDGHNDLPWSIRENEKAPHDVVAYDLRARTPGQTDLARLKEGGLGAQFWSVYVPAESAPGSAVRIQLEQIDIARRMIERYPDRLGLATTADEIEKVFASGRVASLLGMEGGHAIDNSLGALRAFFDLGARYLTLTHSQSIAWADSATDKPRHHGLTRFGEEVVREMNRLGMLVDLSHVSVETMQSALKVSEAPVIFSHSSARALCDHPRNVPDEVLRQLPRNGGLVMVTFVNAFVSQEFARVSAPLWEEYQKRTRGVEDPAERRKVHQDLMRGVSLPKVTLAQVADHVEHVRKLAGVDHVGLGGDFDGNDSWPEGLEDVSKYPNLFAELIRRGWSDSDLRKLAGGNLLRVLRSAEAVARRLQASRPASTATIEQLDGTPGAQAEGKPGS